MKKVWTVAGVGQRMEERLRRGPLYSSETTRPAGNSTRPTGNWMRENHTSQMSLLFATAHMDEWLLTLLKWRMLTYHRNMTDAAAYTRWSRSS